MNLKEQATELQKAFQEKILNGEFTLTRNEDYKYYRIIFIKVDDFQFSFTHWYDENEIHQLLADDFMELEKGFTPNNLKEI
jgi:hypothetical protein